MASIRTLPQLDSIRVAAPCPVSWADMTGDDRVRQCSTCRQSVYDLSAMTRPDAESLIRRTEGRLCVRYFRGADGTVMTRDCPVGREKALRWRVATWVGASALLLITLLGWVLARPGGALSVVDRLRTVELWRSVIDTIDPKPELAMGEPCWTPPAIEADEDE